MGGWSGGVYTRFRNWATDKANSVNPQAANFDQEDDGFAAGLNNCVTKDGLNKPSAPMDWNGQSLTGVLNFANTGTVSLVGGKLSMVAAGNTTIAAPTSGVALTVNGFSTSDTLDLLNATSGSGSSNLLNASNGTDSDLKVILSQVGAASKFVTIGPATSITFQYQSGGVVRAQLVASNINALQANDAGGTMQPVGWKNLPQRAIAADYTTVRADEARHIFHNSATPHTVTIDSNANVPHDIGTVLTIVNVQGGGTVTIAITTDTLVLLGAGTTGSRSLTAAGIATALKVTATQWMISGTNLS